MSELSDILPPYVEIEKTKPQIFVKCPREKIRDLAQHFDKLKLRLITLSAIDFGDKFCVIYQFAFYPAIHNGRMGVIHVKVEVPKDDAKIPTISDIMPPAYLYEREVWEFFGIVFEGHPKLDYLFLSPEFPKFPLRKS